MFELQAAASAFSVFAANDRFQFRPETAQRKAKFAGYEEQTFNVRHNPLWKRATPAVSQSGLMELLGSSLLEKPRRIYANAQPNARTPKIGKIA